MELRYFIGLSLCPEATHESRWLLYGKRQSHVIKDFDENSIKCLLPQSFLKQTKCLAGL